MIKKTFFILTIFILIAVSLSSISAADVGNNVTSNLKTLAFEINSTGAGETLNLEHDYKSINSSNQIIISKSITIDGNNHTIDTPDVSRVFLVNADNVCIKNLNFINSKTTGLAGGVISWWGNNGTLANCNFENNSASSGGGAVLWKGNGGCIENCNFINNNVSYGPAVSLTSGESFDPHQIHIQVVNSEGGALYLQGYNILVNNCNFSNNVALLNGGAICIHWYSNVTISNSRFKNNSAAYYCGAMHVDGDNATIIGCEFENNHQKDLLLNTKALIINSTFDYRSSIEDWYNSTYVNVTFWYDNPFEDLSDRIVNTPEGGILILDRDYTYTGGPNKGILINKTITIDGNGHTINGNHTSRMFNISADNVIIKNINFINGNAYGLYFSNNAGGGSIYWNGANGYIENCNFTNNTGRGLEYDPFDKEETFIDENGTVWHTIKVRPMGAKINEGGAIVWNGTNGTVSNCIFKTNSVGYSNYGGAICWRGDSGNVLESEFYNNDAWAGAAICWIGDNGTILHSKFVNSGSIFGRDIMWFGKNGIIRYSFLISDYGSPIYPYSGGVDADCNFWGDTLDNPNKSLKIEDLNNWVVLNASYNKNFIHKGDLIVVNCNLLLFGKDGNISNFTALNVPGNITAKADNDGFVQLTFDDGKIGIKIVPKTKIVSKDLTKYYKQSKQFKVRVYGADGKVVSGKHVKFTVGKSTVSAKTDKKGYVTFKFNKKPGKYTVYTEYGDVKVKNKIVVKTVLVTKNVSKKVKKTGKFTVKTLNSNGKAVKNKVVKIKFKGKTYKIKSNKKGIATFNLPNNLKVGKYSIKTNYNGLTNINNVIVKK